MATQTTREMGVVYADPDAGAAAEVVDRLDAAGADVYVAESMESALRTVRDRDPDCVVTEFRLPDGDGLEMLRRLRAERDDVPVVVFSNADDPTLTGKVLDAGGAFVPKHGDGGDRLRRRLGNLLSGGAGAGIPESLKERAMDEAPVGITVADATLPDEPLVYVNDAFERLTGYPAEEVLGRNCRFLQGPDTDPDAVRELRAGIESAEAVSVELRNYRRDGEPFWNRVELAPIRDESGTVTHYIGFQTDVTRRRRAAKAARRWAEECRAERRTVEHVLDRVEGLVEEVTQVLVGASSRREVERGVCDRVAATDGYAAAWVGGRDRSRGAVTTRAWTGDASLPLANLSVDLSADAPTARAVSSGDVQLAVDSDAPFPDVEGSSGSSVESMIAVPLTYRETTYGVLNVYATEADAFDDHDAAVLASIGRATGNAINAIESKRMVAADGVVDLEVTVADPDAALAGLADDAGCRLTFEGANRRTDGSVSVFLRADGSVPTDLPSLADSYPSIADATVLDGESEWSLAEITLSPDSVLGRIVDMGVRVTGLDATGEGVSFGFEASGEPVTRSTVDLLEDRFAAVDLTGLRRRERGDRSGHGFARRIRKRLTDRQLTALQKAYFGGFFERPHGVTGGELADSMGITRSTFHQHLLAAQRKLLDGFFEERTERGSVPH